MVDTRDGVTQARERPTQARDAQDPDVVISSLLRTLVTNLDMALDDVAGSVDELGDVFMSMTSSNVSPAGDGSTRFEQCRDRAVCALQFHDRLEQRVRHVCRSLEEVAGLMCCKDERHGIEHWHCLARSLRNACVVELDKRVFENLTHADRSASSGEATDPEKRLELF